LFNVVLSLIRKVQVAGTNFHNIIKSMGVDSIVVDKFQSN